MLQPVKNFLLAILWLVIISAGIYVAYQRDAFASLPKVNEVLSSLLNKKSGETSTLGITPLNNLDQAKIETAFSDATAQLKVLGARGQETGLMSSQVLGDFIQVNEADNEKSTSEKALEYGRYLYCQQVVKEWENQDSKWKIYFLTKTYLLFASKDFLSQRLGA